MDETSIIQDIMAQSWFMPLIIFIVFLLIIMYIYSALTLMAIAQKLKHPSPWLAWIPIANVILIYQISATPSWTIICYFISIVTGFIPFIGFLLSLLTTVVAIYWYWKICERMNRPNWWSIFSLLFLPVWWIMLGIMAWGEMPTVNPNIPENPNPTPPEAPVAPTKPAQS